MKGRTYIILTFVLAVSVLFALPVVANAADGGVKGYFKALPQFAKNPANPVTEEKVELGKLL
ncbi:hypothetical protein MNBD_GAMMA09-1553, partial [hydrothermal vent metagenome]